MSNGIYIVLGMAVILVITLIRCVFAIHKADKLTTALKELYEMPLNAWERKWGEFVQNEYSKCNDPHRQEVEEDMEFFHKELAGLKKGVSND